MARRLLGEHGMRRNLFPMRLVIAISLAGCSLLSMRKPPEIPLPRDQPLTCDASGSVPTLDLVAGLALGAAAIVLFTGPGTSCPPDADECIGPGIARVYDFIGGALLLHAAIGEVTSSLVGRHWANRCAELKSMEGRVQRWRPDRLRRSIPAEAGRRCSAGRARRTGQLKGGAGESVKADAGPGYRVGSTMHSPQKRAPLRPEA